MTMRTPQRDAENGTREDSNPSSNFCALLTAREREVLAALAYGLGSKHAARQLHISYETVRTHQRNIYRKLGAHSLHNALNVYRG